MDDSDLIGFAPVPLRMRRDGWTAKKQYFFILGLARGFTPARAAALLGLTRKSAYALRRKPGGEGFAAAWDAAVARARSRRIEAEAASLVQRGMHGEWVPRLYAGRLVGWTPRVTSVGLMRTLNRLDRLCERLPAEAQPAAMAALREAMEGDTPPAMTSIERKSCHLPPSRQP